MDFDCIIAYPRYKLEQKRIRDFIQQMETCDVKIHEFDVDKISVQYCNQFIQQLNQQKQHIMIHMPAQLVVSEENNELIRQYDKMVSEIPNLIYKLYDSLDIIQQFTSRSKMKGLIQNDPVLKKYLKNIQPSSYFHRIWNKFKNILGLPQSYVCKPDIACCHKTAHQILFLRCTQMTAHSIQRYHNYTIEPYINSKFIYKVYCFQSSTLLVNKVYNDIYNQQHNFKYLKSHEILSQHNIIQTFDKPQIVCQKGDNETVKLTEREYDQINIITYSIFRTFGANFYGYDLAYAEDTKQFVIIDINYNPLPKDGDDLAHVIIKSLSKK